MDFHTYFINVTSSPQYLTVSGKQHYSMFTANFVQLFTFYLALRRTAILFGYSSPDRVFCISMRTEEILKKLESR